MQSMLTVLFNFKPRLWIPFELQASISLYTNSFIYSSVQCVLCSYNLLGNMEIDEEHLLFFCSQQASTHTTKTDTKPAAANGNLFKWVGFGIFEHWDLLLDWISITEEWNGMDVGAKQWAEHSKLRGSYSDCAIPSCLTSQRFNKEETNFSPPSYR